MKGASGAAAPAPGRSSDGAARRAGLARMRVVRMPRAFDGAMASSNGTRGAIRPAPGQSPLALEFASNPGAGVPAPRLRLVRTTPVAASADNLGGVDDFTDRRRTRSSELPDPADWTGRIAQAVAEVQIGSRPPHQLTRWVTHELLGQLRRAHAAAQGRPARAAVRLCSLHVSQPADGVIEATGVMKESTRSRALALRLEGWDGRWICVSAQMI